METLNERIKKLRKEKGITQNQLADALGVTDKAVSKWEVGEANPDISLLVKISEIFGVTVDYLLTGKVQETISLDDMDDEKRFAWILKRDDKENFVKYGYLKSSRVFGKTQDLQMFFHHGMNRRAEIVTINTSSWKEIISAKAHNIFGLCLNEFLDKNKKDGYWLTFTVADFLDDFVKAVVDLDRDDVLKAIGAPYFCIGPCSGNSRNSGKPMLIGPSNIVEDKQAYTIQEDTFRYIFEKEKESPRCFKLMASLCFTGVTADMIQFNRADKPVYVVTYLPEFLLSFAVSQKRYDLVDKYVTAFGEELTKSKAIIEANSQDRNYVRYAVLSASYVSFENAYSNGNQIEGRIFYYQKGMLEALISDGQLDLVHKMNSQNKTIHEIIFGGNRIRADIAKSIIVLTEQEINRMVKLKSNDLSEDERIILECVDEYVINKANFESLTDVKLAKKILDTYFYNYYEFTYDCLTKKNIKTLFKFFVDNELESEAQSLMAGEENYSSILESIWRTFEDSDRKDRLALKQNKVFTPEQKRRGFDVDWNELSKYGFSEDRAYTEDGEEVRWRGDLTENNVLIKVIKARKADMLAVVEARADKIRIDAENAKERAKIVKGLDRKYFEDLLAKKETELFIIKLCALFDAILKFDFKCDGEDFNLRMNQYFDNGPKSQYVDDGWGYDTLDTEHEEKVVKPWNNLRDLFNRLRIQRNNIAHSESKPNKELTMDELKTCLEHVLSINKEEK